MEDSMSMRGGGGGGGSSSRSHHRHDDDDEEESGWTAYFDDFSNNSNNRGGEDDDQETSYSSSLVSDAASCAAWRFELSNKQQHHHHDHLASTKGMPKKLKFNKKPRARQICDDDSLEDTASSPANSPKLSDFADMNNPRTEQQPHDLDHMYSSLGKGGISSEKYCYSAEMQQKERSLMGFNGGHQIQSDCADLKRRGLCLVPLSMLVNYLG